MKWHSTNGELVVLECYRFDEKRLGIDKVFFKSFDEFGSGSCVF